MSLSVEDLHNRKAQFSEQTARLARAGYERFAAPEFILDRARALARPVLDVGTGSGKLRDEPSLALPSPCP